MATHLELREIHHAALSKQGGLGHALVADVIQSFGDARILPEVRRNLRSRKKRACDCEEVVCVNETFLEDAVADLFARGDAKGAPSSSAA